MYPDGVYLPGTGTQRGSLLVKHGDPLTPGYPAIGKNLRNQSCSMACVEVKSPGSSPS